MKKIDSQRLIICDLQSELFVKSRTLECSSEIFIRRFMNSKIVKLYDNEQILYDTVSPEDVFEYLNEEYGETKYGKIKYSEDELYWIGHLYRYFACTYELSSRQVYKIVKPKELKSLFKAYHSLDTAQAIERILEAKNLNLNIDYMEKGLEILRKLRKNINTYYYILSKDEHNKRILKLNNLNEIKEQDIVVLKYKDTDEIIKTKVIKVNSKNNENEKYLNEEETTYDLLIYNDNLRINLKIIN